MSEAHEIEEFYEHHNIVADKGQEPLRVDKFLLNRLEGTSRNKIQQSAEQGYIQVNGKIVKSNYKVKPNDEVRVMFSLPPRDIELIPQNIPINIVYEDEHILVINKPADLIVHPGAGNPSGTVLNALLNHCPEIDKVPRAGIVHRLDKDTTGLMVVAKTIPAQTHLVDQLQRREMGREYEAVALGTMVAGGIVDAPIGRHATKRTHMAVREMGKPAVTHFRVIEKFRAYTHLRLKLETGRTHQIRVHMAHIKHPLLGDQVYGGRPRLPKRASEEFIAALRGFQRQALHAAQLSLFHPETEEWMTWKAPLPQDMQDLLKAVKKDTADNPQDML